MVISGDCMMIEWLFQGDFSQRKWWYNEYNGDTMEIYWDNTLSFRHSIYIYINMYIFSTYIVAVLLIYNIHVIVILSAENPASAFLKGWYIYPEEVQALGGVVSNAGIINTPGWDVYKTTVADGTFWGAYITGDFWEEIHMASMEEILETNW